MHFGRICAAVHCRWSLWDQKLLKLDVAVTLACCQAVVCTSALISEGCTLAGRLLQCTFAGHCAFVRAAYFHGKTCSEPAVCFLLCSAHQLISEGCTLAGCLLQCTFAGHCAFREQHTFTEELQ